MDHVKESVIQKGNADGTMKLETALEKASETIAASVNGESVLLHGMKRQPSGTVVVSKLETVSNPTEARNRVLKPANGVVGRVHGSPTGNIMIQSTDHTIHDTWNAL